MDRRMLWVASAGLGAATIVFTSLAWLLVVAWVLLLMPFVRRGGAVALSGALTGSGLLWSFLIWRTVASGSTIDNAAAWIALGLVPLAVGLTLLTVIASRSHRTATNG